MTDTDQLAAIAERTDNFPRLIAAENDGTNPASVYEEEDGLETLCTIPDYYPAEVQNGIARDFVDMRNDRERLLVLVREQQAAIDALSDWAGRSRTGFYDEAQDDVVQIIRKALEARL